MVGLGAIAQAESLPPVPQVQAITALEPLSSDNHSLPADSALSSGVVPYAPAPPLTDMWVYAVGSTNCGWEVTAGLATTPCDHGGPELRAAVLEIGYSSNRIAWMNGGLLPTSAMYASTLVCVSGGYYVWPCPVGQTAVGFLREYTLDGPQNGLFQYQATSSNAPFNTMSVRISIK